MDKPIILTIDDDPDLRKTFTYVLRTKEAES